MRIAPATSRKPPASINKSVDKAFRMKMIISILICVVVLGYCEAQFGGFVATQNCADSSCNQNNFGRKRRQILEEILTEVEAEEAAREVAKREAEAEELAREVAKREAEAESQRFGSEGF